MSQPAAFKMYGLLSISVQYRTDTLIQMKIDLLLVVKEQMRFSSGGKLYMKRQTLISELSDCFGKARWPRKERKKKKEKKGGAERKEIPPPPPPPPPPSF